MWNRVREWVKASRPPVAHGRVGPGVFPAAPDLVEALTETGALDDARKVSDRLRAIAERHEHPWALAGAQRAGAMIALAAPSYDADAAEALAEAAATYGALGLGFDRARTLLSLGRAQRRLKQWGAARETLQTAVTAFAALGSKGWADRARADLERVGGRRPRSSGELTPTERQIVELAAEGLANKEIARNLDIAEATTKIHAAAILRELGVRNRTEAAVLLQTWMSRNMN